MTTYTLAIGGDMLLATLRDGGDLDAAIKEFEALADAYAATVGVRLIIGCTLTDDEDDERERVWTSGNSGWIIDEHGRDWRFAVRAKSKE